MNLTRHLLPDLLDQDDDHSLPNLAIDETGTGHCDLNYLFTGRRRTMFLMAIRKAIPAEHDDYLPPGLPLAVRFAGVPFTVNHCYDLDVHKGYRIAFRGSYVVSFDVETVRAVFGLNIMSAEPMEAAA